MDCHVEETVKEQGNIHIHVVSLQAQLSCEKMVQVKPKTLQIGEVYIVLHPIELHLLYHPEPGQQNFL
jgi:hypothetical protein